MKLLLILAVIGLLPIIQELVRIPVAAEATGKLSSVEIWSVNFRDPARKERDELFTVWVTKDGRTADIRHLHSGLGG